MKTRYYGAVLALLFTTMAFAQATWTPTGSLNASRMTHGTVMLPICTGQAQDLKGGS